MKYYRGVDYQDYNAIKSSQDKAQMSSPQWLKIEIQCQQKLKELADRHYLTEEEQVEEVRLKKMKLRLKDQMERILGDSRRTQNVA